MMKQQRKHVEPPIWLDQVLGFFSPPFSSKNGGSAVTSRNFLVAGTDLPSAPIERCAASVGQPKGRLVVT